MENAATKGNEPSEAIGVWLETRDAIDGWITSTLHTMGLPEHASEHGVRRALLGDFFLREDIHSEVAEAYWRTVRIGGLTERDGLSWTECARRWLCCVTRWTTQRLATAQARLLVQEASDTGSAEASWVSASCPDQETERREALERLAHALRRLPAEDARLLVLRDGWVIPFVELLAEFGTSIGALRTRVCRARAKARSVVTGEAS